MTKVYIWFLATCIGLCVQNFVIVSNSYAASKKGGVGDGGGSAVACFGKNPKFDIKSVLDIDGRIKSEYRDEIGLLWLTDFYESLGSPSTTDHTVDYIYPKDDETPETFLARVVRENIYPLSPAFAKSLEASLQATRRELWVPTTEGLPAILDHGEAVDLQRAMDGHKDFCTFVQIVRRKETLNSPESMTSKIISIEYDPDLYEKIFVLNKDIGIINNGILQQSFLLLHEALYAMGAQMGHTDSENTRKLGRILLRNGTYQQLNSNFDFLYLLHNTGFLNSNLFGYNKTRPVKQDSLLHSFTEILNRISLRKYDVPYEVSAELSTNIARQWPSLFTPSELDGNHKTMAFILFNILKYSKAPSSALEQLLTYDENFSRKAIRYECSQLKIWIKANKFNQNLHQSRAENMNYLSQELIMLEKAKEFCDNNTSFLFF